MGPLFVVNRTASEGEGIELCGGIVGGLMIFCCFEDEGVDR